MRLLSRDVAGSAVPWHEIAESSEFKRLESLRRRALVITLGVFAVITGTFLVLIGHARPFMRKSVDGGLTVAYVWILALTVLTWVLVWAYLRFAERLERRSQVMLRRGGYSEEGRELLGNPPDCRGAGPWPDDRRVHRRTGGRARDHVLGGSPD